MYYDPAENTVFCGWDRLVEGVELPPPTRPPEETPPEIPPTLVRCKVYREFLIH